MKKLLSLLVAVTLLMGCVGAFAEGDAHPYDLPIVTDGSVKASIYMTMESGSEQAMENYEDHTAIKEWEKRTGIDFTFVHPPMNDTGEYFNMVVASGEYPDAWATGNFDTYYPGGTDGAIEDGLLVNPNTLIDQYGYHYVLERAKWDEQVSRNMKTDAGTWRFGAANQRFPVLGMVHTGAVVRKDILEANNIKVPETMEEVTEMLRGMKAAGIEIPLALHRLRDGYYGDNGFLTAAFDTVDGSGSGNAKGFMLEEDKKTVTYYALQPGFKDYLALLRGWMEEGLIDRDFVNRIQEDSRKLFTSGRAGMVFIGNWQTKELLQLGAVADENFDLMGLSTPALNTESIGTPVPFGQPIVNGTNGMWWSISASSPNQEAIFKAFDYLYSYEGTELMVFGVNELEDGTVIHSTNPETGYREFSDYILNNPNLAYNTIRYIYTIQNLSSEYSTDMEIQQYNSPWQHQCWDAWTKNVDNSRRLPSKITLTADESREVTPIVNTIDSFIIDKQLKIICGDEPLENWDGYVAQLDSYGVQTVIDVMQAAFDRYEVR